MKNRVRRSAVLFLSMMLTVALLAGISPASSAAPLQLGTFEMDRAVPAIAEKAGELGAVDAAQQAGEEVPLKDRLLKDELLKEAEVSADPDEAAAAAEPEAAEAALPEMLTEVELFPEAAEAPGRLPGFRRLPKLLRLPRSASRIFAGRMTPMR